MRGIVLVVDDHARPRRALATELADAGFAVVEASDGAEAWRLFCRDRPDVVITDLVMPRSDGLELLTRIRTRSDVPVILFTAHGSVEATAAAFKAGADEFVASPDVEIEDLVRLVSGAVGAQRPARDLAGFEQRITGRSEAIARVRARAAALAPLRTPVLVEGEGGAGCSTLVRAIHELGSSANGRLLVVPARAFPATPPAGDFAAIHLDAVDQLPPAAQAQWGERLAKAEANGFSSGPRLLASTSSHLLSSIRDGSFHAELGTFLVRFSIEIPALRERAEDVPELADALVEQIGQALGRRVRLSPAARDYVASRRWPGNVRELQRLLERAVTFSRGPRIRRQLVEELLADSERSLASVREQHVLRERQSLVRAIEETGGNVTRVAELLGRSRGAIYRLLLKHGIPLQRER